jgi:hypothetical protein
MYLNFLTATAAAGDATTGRYMAIWCFLTHIAKVCRKTLENQLIRGQLVPSIQLYLKSENWVTLT